MNDAAADASPRGEAGRLRPVRRVLAVGAGLSLLGALATGALGGPGAGSLAAFLIGFALTCGAAGLVTLVGAVRDEARDRPVPRRRVGVGVGLLLGAPLLLVLAAGAASTT